MSKNENDETIHQGQVSVAAEQKMKQDSYRGAGVAIMGSKNIAKVASAGTLQQSKHQNVNSGSKLKLVKKSSFGKSQIYSVVTIQKKSELLGKKKNICGTWDGMTPLTTYSSTTHSPEDMSETVEKIFKKYLNNNVDFEKASKYMFVGKKYSLEGDCDFRINIYSPGATSEETTICEVEIQKMGGYTLAFAGIRDQFVLDLLKENSIEKNQGEEIGIIGVNDDCGFRVEPFPMNEVNMEKLKDVEPEKKMVMTKESAEKLMKDVVNVKAFGGELRYSIQLLRKLFDKKENLEYFTDMSSKAMKQMIIFMQQSCDAWVIKVMLECINLMLSNKLQACQGLADHLSKLQSKWSKPVINSVNDAKFKFPPSYQVQKLCGELLNKL